MSGVHHDAVLLAGGRGARLGGVDKPALRLGDRTLVERALGGVPGARAIAIVTHSPVPVDDARVVVVGEEPRWAGPVAALAAGLAALEADAAPFTVVLAADLVDPAAGLAELLAAASASIRRGASVDGVVAVDPGGFRQPLLAVYRTRSLREALAADAVRRADPGSRGASVRSVLERLRLRELPLSWSACADIDTPADAAWHGITIPGTEAAHGRVA
jgi:molybdopterin-guanine dinucleotide biosynthesis protein A